MEPVPLSLSSTLFVVPSVIAIDAGVQHFSGIGRTAISKVLVIIALDMLPRFASLAEHRKPIVDLEAAEALYGVILFFLCRTSIAY